MLAKQLTYISILVLAVSIVSCNEGKQTKKETFLDLSGSDSSVKPGDNFFFFANGSWYRETAIPADQVGWGVAYALYEDNRKKLHAMLEEASLAKDPVKGSVGQMIGEMYAAAMDSTEINKKGYAPVTEDLKRVDNLKTPLDIVVECARQYTQGEGLIMGAVVNTDDKNASVYRLQFHQDGLSLPDRDYYIRTDSAGKSILSAFVKYAADVFRAIGYDSVLAGNAARDVLALETKLATSHATQVELRDPVKNYNKFSVAEISRLTPGIDWTAFIKAYGANTDTIIVGQPAYFKMLGQQLSATPVEVWKHKVKLKLVEDAPLGNPFEDLKFNFYSKTLRGVQEKPVRWKRMTRLVSDLAGDMMGQLYTQKYFPEASKKRMLDLVNNLQVVYKKRMQDLDWMGDSTRQKALEKLNGFVKKIGYPDKWKDYAGVNIQRNDHFNNVKQLRIYNFKRELVKIDKPVDRTEWFMNAAEVNAYYNPAFNEIVFPAGILQPPFFNAAADDAINYGAIGAVIGHEMTHGFDDYGRQYDAAGNLHDWWTGKDATAFKKKAQQVVDQYNAFVLFDSLHVNGELTLGENIADIGGLMIAYEAFKNTEQGKSENKIDGLTPDQRFFLSFATVWREKTTDASAKEWLVTDPHSPNQFRLNGAVSNMEAFYKTFGIKPGDKMYRPDSIRVNIW